MESENRKGNNNLLTNIVGGVATAVAAGALAIGAYKVAKMIAGDDDKNYDQRSYPPGYQHQDPYFAPGYQENYNQGQNNFGNQRLSPQEEMRMYQTNQNQNNYYGNNNMDDYNSFNNNRNNYYYDQYNNQPYNNNYNYNQQQNYYNDRRPEHNQNRINQIPPEQFNNYHSVGRDNDQPLMSDNEMRGIEFDSMFQHNSVDTYREQNNQQQLALMSRGPLNNAGGGRVQVNRNFNGNNRDNFRRNYQTRGHQQEEELQFYPSNDVNLMKKEPKIQCDNPDYCCPITQEFMENPHILIGCGHSFEKSAIESWLKKKNICPVCKKQANYQQIVPNYSLKTILEQKKNEILKSGKT